MIVRALRTVREWLATVGEWLTPVGNWLGIAFLGALFLSVFGGIAFIAWMIVDGLVHPYHPPPPPPPLHISVYSIDDDRVIFVENLESRVLTNVGITLNGKYYDFYGRLNPDRELHESILKCPHKLSSDFDEADPDGNYLGSFDPSTMKAAIFDLSCDQGRANGTVQRQALNAEQMRQVKQFLSTVASKKGGNQ
ncbi:MAG TPA: hypothetical protein VFW40_10700 [Capsulimonadaceae bacterium]|nr:hypothetical protein [Capsulimonadaceae bacterium]